MRRCVQQCQMMGKLLLWLSFIGDHQCRGEQDPRTARCFISEIQMTQLQQSPSKLEKFYYVLALPVTQVPHICAVQPWRLLSCSHICIKTLAIIAHVFQALLLLMPLLCAQYNPVYPYPCTPYMYSAILPLRWNGCSVPSCVGRQATYFSCIVPYDQRLPWVPEEAVDF